ncbi:MAG: Gx transporter family protein [Bacillota bacterium]|jgi:heptaprenyl diphosphate synthase|nr:Gx transporter family protein [Bacillota bacterium]HHU43684.1 Gx transporter family protein [Clostridiales bacterium]
MKSKNLAIASMLLAASMIIGVVENLIPPIIPFLPYVKLGLSNVVIIIAILLLNYKYAFAIIALKSILVPLLVANPVMILYSLPSSLLSVALTTALLYTRRLSIPVISVLSAILHNIIQLCVAAIMTNSLVFGFLPYFIIIGSVSGLITGIISFVTIKYIPPAFYKSP